jgi:hypothetical protein
MARDPAKAENDEHRFGVTMDDQKERDSRTTRLRKRIAERNQPTPGGSSGSSDEAAPRKGESYVAFTERRMRETIKKKPE